MTLQLDGFALVTDIAGYAGDPRPMILFVHSNEGSVQDRSNDLRRQWIRDLSSTSISDEYLKKQMAKILSLRVVPVTVTQRELPHDPVSS